MSDDSYSPRGRSKRTRFDDTNRRVFFGSLIGVVVLAIVIGVLIALSAQNPDLALTLQLGGPSRAQDSQPRNFRLWAVLPDGRLRFATAFFPSQNNAPASEAFTVAGPLVNSPKDVQQTQYFGALSINSADQSGTGNDSSRYFKMFWIEHDPRVASYGVDMITQKPPYIAKDTSDKSDKLYYVAMGAPQQTYYSQVVVAIAFPPGVAIDNVAYPLPVSLAGDAKESMLRPYRRSMINGWTVYYFDQTTLPEPQTVRVRYTPPASAPADASGPELSLWEVDRMR